MAGPKLCRYVAKPPIVHDRLALYALERKFRDGSTHVVFEALTLIERLCVLVLLRRRAKQAALLLSH